MVKLIRKSSSDLADPKLRDKSLPARRPITAGVASLIQSGKVMRKEYSPQKSMKVKQQTMSAYSSL